MEVTQIIGVVVLFLLYGVAQVIIRNNNETAEVEEINKRYLKGGDLYSGL